MTTTRFRYEAPGEYAAIEARLDALGLPWLLAIQEPGGLHVGESLDKAESEPAQWMALAGALGLLAVDCVRQAEGRAAAAAFVARLAARLTAAAEE